MKNPIDFEDELDAIRVAIYEEIKDMTPAEEVAYINEQGASAAKDFNIRVIAAAPSREDRKVPPSREVAAL
jgi:hypothetical protein